MILIVSYGNTLRGDDGAGIVLGELFEASCRKRHLQVQRLVCHQLTPELVIDIIEPGLSLVIFTDTHIVVPGNSGLDIEIERIVPADNQSAIGHNLSPTTLLLMADQLYHKSVTAWQATVPGISFGHGDLQSQTTQRALANAPQRIASFFGDLNAADSQERFA